MMAKGGAILETIFSLNVVCPPYNNDVKHETNITLSEFEFYFVGQDIVYEFPEAFTRMPGCGLI